MPRPHRNWIPSGVYHVTLRGNNRQAIFLEDADYQQYLITLRECQQTLPYRLHAFVLMPNHVHLVMENAAGASLSAVMHQVSTCYTRYFNAKRGRVGHLYQGRFYSNVVTQDSYLLEVTRYVHLNPWRAGLVQHPRGYLWSSYKMYLGLERSSLVRNLVDSSRVLQMLDGVPDNRAKRYADFVERLAPSSHDTWVRALRRLKLVPSARLL